MSQKLALKQELTKNEPPRFKEARKNLKEMQKKIAPFTNKNRFRVYTTEGNWHDYDISNSI